MAQRPLVYDTDARQIKAISQFPDSGGDTTALLARLKKTERALAAELFRSFKSRVDSGQIAVGLGTVADDFENLDAIDQAASIDYIHEPPTVQDPLSGAIRTIPPATGLTAVADFGNAGDVSHEDLRSAQVVNDGSTDTDCYNYLAFDTPNPAVDSRGLTTWTNVGAVQDLTIHKHNGSAMSVPGDADYLHVEDADLPAGHPLKSGAAQTGFTVCGWFYHTEAVTSYEAFFGKSRGSGGNTLAIANNNGPLRIDFGRVGGIDYIDGTHTIQTGRWYFVAVTLGADGQTYAITLWDDTAGSEVDSLSGSLTAAFLPENTRIRLGKTSSTSASGYPFTGVLDSWRIYGKALPPAELASLRDNNTRVSAATADTFVVDTADTSGSINVAIGAGALLERIRVGCLLKFAGFEAVYKIASLTGDGTSANNIGLTLADGSAIPGGSLPASTYTIEWIRATATADGQTSHSGALGVTATALHAGISLATAHDVTDLSSVVAAPWENLLPDSAALSTWESVNFVVTPDAATAPDGTMTAVHVAGAAGQPVCLFRRMVTPTPSTVHVVSIHAKAAENTTFLFDYYDDGTADVVVQANISTGSISTVQGGVLASGSEDVGDGWWRFWFAVQTGADVTNSQMQAARITDGSGDGTSGVYLWEPQVETASVLSSHISTSGTAKQPHTRAYVALSFDGVAFEVWTGAAWHTVAREQGGTWQYRDAADGWHNATANTAHAALSQAMGYAENRMNAATLAAITPAQLAGKLDPAMPVEMAVTMEVASTGDGSAVPAIEDATLTYAQQADPMDLVSEAVALASSPALAVVYLDLESIDELTLGTDVAASVSRDDGANWEPVSLTLHGAIDAASALATGELAFTAGAGGTALRVRLQTANGKQLRLHGWMLAAHEEA